MLATIENNTKSAIYTDEAILFDFCMGAFHFTVEDYDDEGNYAVYADGVFVAELPKTSETTMDELKEYAYGHAYNYATYRG